MPMKKSSTLMYFVHYLQKDLELNDPATREFSTGGFLDPDGKHMVAPSAKSLNNIMNFARSYEVVKTKNAGCVEMILN
jgi:hypothetical protein